ncbi:MAG TPA: flagellar hook-basal body complex protein [Gallionella sp.]|nr:flagellar hook-basal body complex protein [Gallionella sp.]
MSFQQGLSGLNASAKQLDTIGNNVANSSTVGFKQSQAQFADMYAASLSGSGGAQIGTGVRLAAVVQQFTQGNVTNTNNPMDTAISGQGFFRMVDPNGAVFYSRNGQFQVDKNGFIVNSLGHKASGYLPNAAGMIVPAQPVPLQINAADLTPKATATMNVGVNLDSRSLGAGAGGGVPITRAFSPTDPTSYNNSTPMTIYDSLGVSHVASLYFQRQPIASTTTSAAVAVGDSQVTLASTAGLAIGNTITIPGAGPAAASLTATITGIAGNAVTFTPTVSTAVAAGATVTSNAASPNWKTFFTIDGALVPAAASTTVGAGAIGATTVTLATLPPGLAVGESISIAGAGAGAPPGAHIATITGIAGAVVTFSPQTPAASAAGAVVTATVPLTTLTFDALGKLTAPAGPPVGAVVSGSFQPTGANQQTVSFNFGATSQYGGNFGVNSMTQDGYASGRLNSFSTSADGTIQGRYSNGQSRALGQVLLANFTNPQGLQPVGNNEWAETAASGGALIGTPGSSSLGVLQSSAVEDSNVDLTAELVNMITAQRVYQANAQTIKAQDQVLQTLVNLR